MNSLKKSRKVHLEGKQMSRTRYKELEKIFNFLGELITNITNLYVQEYKKFINGIRCRLIFNKVNRKRFYVEEKL